MEYKQISAFKLQDSLVKILCSIIQEAYGVWDMRCGAWGMKALKWLLCYLNVGNDRIEEERTILV